MAQMNFDANNHEPAGSFAVYDSGVYTVMVNGSEFKETKAKKEGRAAVGSYLQLNLRIAEGPHSGGTLIDRINWENENPDAVSIGQSQLSAICRVVGVMQLQDSQQLHGIPFKVEVAKAPRNDDPSKFSNEIRAYLDINGNEASQVGKATEGSATPPTQSAPPTSTPPAADPTPPVMTKPTDPAHIHEAGTPGEMWWNGTEWVKPPADTTPTPPPATEPPQDPPAPTQPAGDDAGTPPWLKNNS